MINKKYMLFNICVSVLIAIFLGTMYMTISVYGQEVLFTFIKIAIIGIVMSILSELVFCLLDILFKKHIMISFIGVFIIILVGTILASLIMGVRNVNHILILTAAAEGIGISFTYISFKYQTKMLNDKLKEKKEKYRKRV